MTTLTPRTQWYTRGGQWSLGDRSPLCMVERRRGWSSAGHSRPRDGHRKGARAPGSRGEQDARKEKRVGGGREEEPTERKSLASSAMLRRAMPVEGGPFHGKLMRAWAARGRGGTQRKMEAPAVNCGGRNRQRRRTLVRPVAEESRWACSAAAVEQRRKKWSEWGGRARRWAS
jgi:hypothetical protein